ncbi:MAG: four helix bundle protein [Candidatus Paceibacterota bacterium]
MSTYTSLAVYKASYDFLILLINLTKNFDREYKYTIGENVKKEAMEMMKNIYRANSSEDKPGLIQAARENIEMIRLDLRVLQDLKQLNLRKFVFLNARVETVSKQLVAWQRSFNSAGRS